MRSKRASLRIAFWIAAFTVWHGHADAGQRSFVATTGVDNPGCSFASPCRTFAAAVGAVNIAGEVIVLDSGGYGGVTITKAVSILAAPGVYAGVAVGPAADGVTINAPGATVVLRGLDVNGQGGGNVGIKVTQAARVRIQNTTVSNITGNGIDSVGADVAIFDSVLRDNGGDGIAITGGTASVERVEVLHNGGNGLRGDSGSDVTVTASVSARNGQSGIVAHAAAGATARTSVADSVLSDNAQAGLLADGAAASSCVRATVSHSTLARQASGIRIASPSQISDMPCGVFAVADANTITESGVAFDIASPFVGFIYTRANNTLYHNGADVSLAPNLHTLGAQ